MTVYIDDIEYYPNSKLGAVYSCHMATDQNDLAELHRFAKQLDMRPSWFQNKPTLPHYDVLSKIEANAIARRNRAIALGAKPVNAVELVKHCSLVFKKKAKDVS